MIIYVTTERQLKQAFDDWIAENPIDERRIIQRVFEAFMATASLHTVSGLVCFAVETWELKFRRWIETEVERAPASEGNIRRYAEMVIDHIYSPWGIEHKLIVRECLDAQEQHQLRLAL
jgi:S-methylmethionine-dependent homocysteine/selenocysteine methylase